ncbi:MAG TPA: hypothetical protein VFF68_07640 [Anaerolineaceae bacterium]|nr:hypothetical protein [Anaerolineaceae bacterium]
MNRNLLTLIILIAVLLTAAFLPRQTAHAAGIPQPEAAESPRPEPESPVVAVAVGLTVLLFGGLSVLPLLWGEGMRGGVE